MQLKATCFSTLGRCSQPRLHQYEPRAPAALVGGFHRCEVKLAGTIRRLDESYQINRLSQWANQA
ncbi:hypothetical protein NXC24_PB00077 (plasmid) [Rhizobium sp. NXC24]|nr:hypothetical protein NXC24_PB00077 [Rhizobium sp. NXC24]